jgi:hypothetical protein
MADGGLAEILRWERDQSLKLRMITSYNMACMRTFSFNFQFPRGNYWTTGTRNMKFCMKINYKDLHK